MEFLVSEVPLQNQLFLVFCNFKVMNNKFLIMSVCKHMETLQLGFFSYEFHSSENICGRHVLFVGLSLFGLCLFFGDSGCWLNCHCVWFFLCWLTATDWTCKSMCILYQKKHKKSPNSLLYKTNQTTKQRSCYSKVDTVIKYNFLSCQCEISMKSCSSTACLYSQSGTVTGTCVRHQGTECALVCVIKDVLPV